VKSEPVGPAATIARKNIRAILRKARAQFWTIDQAKTYARRHVNALFEVDERKASLLDYADAYADGLWEERG